MQEYEAQNLPADKKYKGVEYKKDDRRIIWDCDYWYVMKAKPKHDFTTSHNIIWLKRKSRELTEAEKSELVDIANLYTAK